MCERVTRDVIGARSASLDDELSEVELPDEQLDPMGRHSMSQCNDVSSFPFHRYLFRSARRAVCFVGLSGLVFLVSLLSYYVFN